MEFEDRCHKVQEPKFDCLLFDLDDTLYPMSSGIAGHVKKNIEDYMVEKLGIEESKIETLGNLLYKNYGTTMAGLRAIGYNFDYDEYHGFVHGRLPYDNIKPDPVLKHILKNLRIRKLVCFLLKSQNSLVLPTRRKLIHVSLLMPDIHERRHGSRRASPPEAGPGGLLRGHHLLRDPEPAVPAVRRGARDLRHCRSLRQLRQHRRSAQDPRPVQAQRRRHGGGAQDRQRQPAQSYFLRRQRTQHPGREADRPAHGAGRHVAAGERRGPRAGEHPQHQGGAAGALGGGREGGGRALRRARRDRDLGHRVKTLRRTVHVADLFLEMRTAAIITHHAVRAKTLVIFSWNFSIGRDSNFRPHVEVQHVREGLMREQDNQVCWDDGPNIYVSARYFSCKLRVEVIIKKMDFTLMFLMLNWPKQQ